MLKILQVRLRQHVNCELPGVQAGFRKGRRTRDQIVNICWIIEKARKFHEKLLFLLYWLCQAFDCVVHNKLWKILKEMGIPDHLTCLLRNMYAGPEITVRLDMEKWTGSKLGKEYVKAVYCHPADLTYMQSTSCKMSDWIKHKLESRFQGEISITLDTQVIAPLCQEVKRNSRASWWKWERIVKKLD